MSGNFAIVTYFSGWVNRAGRWCRGAPCVMMVTKVMPLCRLWTLLFLAHQPGPTWVADAISAVVDVDVVVVGVAAPLRDIAGDQLVCVTMDWWPGDKYSSNPGAHYPWVNSSVLTADFTSPTLASALAALSPLRLRVGGSLADQITYQVGAAVAVSQVGGGAGTRNGGVGGRDSGGEGGGHVAVRVGEASPADDDHGGGCAEPVANASEVLGYGPGCLTGKRYVALHALCNAAGGGGSGVSSRGCGLVFGLNGLAGRLPTAAVTPENGQPKLWAGPWDPSNALELLTFTRDSGLSLTAVELGNEIDGAAGIAAKVDPQTYAADFVALRSVVDAVWPDGGGGGGGGARPLVVGPDSSGFSDGWWYPQFLGNLSALVGPAGGSVVDVLDAVTWHLYLLGSGNSSAVPSEAVNASVLNALAAKCKLHLATLAKYSSPLLPPPPPPPPPPSAAQEQQQLAGSRPEEPPRALGPTAAPPPPPPLWLGEGGGAYGSGADGTTNAFLSTFWYGDSLGTLAVQGHDCFCRQALLGGNYGLLQTTATGVVDAASTPGASGGGHGGGGQLYANPDLYTAVLWRHLMGPRVLAASTLGPPATTPHVPVAPRAPVPGEQGAWAQGGNGTQGNLRTYAHCAASTFGAWDGVLGTGAFPPGAVALLLLNLDQPASGGGGGGGGGATPPRRVVLRLSGAGGEGGGGGGCGGGGALRGCGSRAGRTRSEQRPEQPPEPPPEPPPRGVPRQQRMLVWRLTGPGGPSSHALAVNGVTLSLDPVSGALVLPLPLPVEVNGPAKRAKKRTAADATAADADAASRGSEGWDDVESVVVLAPLSAAFVVLPDAMAPACL